MSRFFIITALFCTLAASAIQARDWNLDNDSVSAAIADADWTIDEVFPGTKLILEGDYTFRQREIERPEDRPRKTEFIGNVTGEFQWGQGETGLEYARLTATTFATQWDEDYRDGFQRVRDHLIWGKLLFSKDDPLGLDSYTELTIAEAGRTWGWKWAQDSSWRVNLGVRGSLGWSWAESLAPQYDDVSNPFMGFFTYLALEHEKLGRLYTDDRIVQGTTLGNPRSNSTAREARIRFGYFVNVYRCLTLDVFLEKRSFNFADSELPDFYNSSRRIGAALGCRFSGR